MRKLVFALLVIGYGLVASIIMLPLSILDGLFGLFVGFWSELIRGIKLYNKQENQKTQNENKAFSWEDYALKRDALNAKPKETK